MIKIGICGHFGGDKIFLDGQTVKTKIITQELKKLYSIKIVDTFNGKKRIVIILLGLLKLLIQCENVIILPAHNSLKIFVPFLIFFNKIFKRKLHYIVIGGWLSKCLKDNKILKDYLKDFNYIYVETSMMKRSLEEQGFENISIMPNCKDLKILKEKELIYNTEKPYKLCTFSRVMQEKGIEDAIEVVKIINKNSKEIIYTLDIYGQIDENYKERFEKLSKSFPEYIKYKGKIPFDKSVEILKKYNLLLFPTHFYTEGIPGTIIDAYASGVPIISSKWQNYDDIIKENITGIGYEFGQNKKFMNILEKLISSPEKILNMKKNCLNFAEHYKPEKVIQILVKNI